MCFGDSVYVLWEVGIYLRVKLLSHGMYISLCSVTHGPRVVPNPALYIWGVQSLSQGAPRALDPGIKGQGGGRDLKKQRLVFREELNQKSATRLFPNDGESCGLADGSIHSEA